MSCLILGEEEKRKKGNTVTSRIKTKAEVKEEGVIREGTEEKCSELIREREIEKERKRERERGGGGGGGGGAPLSAYTRCSARN